MTNRAYWASLAFAVAALLLLSFAAFAQAPVAVVAAAPSALSVALSNSLVALLAVAVPIVGTFLTLALNRLRAKWGMQAIAQNTSNTESDLAIALKAGITKTLPLIAAKGWASPDVRTAVLSEATAYLQQRFPDRAAQIVAAAQPVGPTAPAVPDTVAVKETLAARLPDAVAIAAASPATPPVTP